MLLYPHSYYLCQSGTLKRKAEEHRTIHCKLQKALFTAIKPYGSSEADIDTTMMLIRRVKFRGSQPAGWTKRDDRGLSRPLPTKANAAILKYFTPSGCHSVDRHPDLQPFFSWLACPSGYEYTHAKGTGWTSISFHGPSLYWYDRNGPLLLVTPDVAQAKREALAEKQTVVNNVLDWTPPRGAKLILKEEWALMAAVHEQKEKKS
jgi:hypothetical protein